MKTTADRLRSLTAHVNLGNLLAEVCERLGEISQQCTSAMKKADFDDLVNTVQLIRHQTESLKPRLTEELVGWLSVIAP